jgi:hypothetical protein
LATSKAEVSLRVLSASVVPPLGNPSQHLGNADSDDKRREANRNRHELFERPKRSRR